MWRQIPNTITVARILLIVPFSFAMAKQEFALAFVLFFAAGVSDALDGFLAKHFHLRSRIGSILDPLADKLLLVSGFAWLTWLGLLPRWLLFLVLLRDILIVSGAVFYRVRRGPYDMHPIVISKINTALQILLVVVHLASLFILVLPLFVFQFLLWATVVSTIGSGIEYVRIWSANYRNDQLKKTGIDHNGESH